MPNRWLFKTEPQAYSYEDLLRDQRVMWRSLGNSITLKNLREVRLGDQILIYHEGHENAVVGTAEAVSDAYPDPKDDDASVVVVEIKPKRKFVEPLLLAEIRAARALNGFDPARLPLLSVMPVSSVEWQVIQELSR